MYTKYVTDLSPIRGQAKKFKELDIEIRWLNYDLNMLVIRDDQVGVAIIRKKLAVKYVEIQSISK